MEIVKNIEEKIDVILGWEKVLYSHSSKIALLEKIVFGGVGLVVTAVLIAVIGKVL